MKAGPHIGLPKRFPPVSRWQRCGRLNGFIDTALNPGYTAA
jgi:hypothetical protein